VKTRENSGRQGESNIVRLIEPVALMPLGFDPATGYVLRATDQQRDDEL
jgi:hypothetical protein